MKKYLLSLAAALFVTTLTVNAQTPMTPQAPEAIWINEGSHNFGKIPQGTPVTTIFKVKSNTTDSLRLEAVQAGCGCTTPVFTPGTYAPGAAVDIKVGYNAAAMGAFNKPVTIIFNGGQQKVIFISGEVVNVPTTPAPENKGIARIKE